MSHPDATPNSPSVRDATLKSTDALPNAASTTVNGTAIDLGPITGISARSELCEVLLTAPAVTDTMVPNTKTMTYHLETSATSNFASATRVVASAIVQTGAGSGVVTSNYRWKIPSTCQRYLRAVAVSGANTTNAAAVDMTLELLF
jgi:hypothetical protein